MLGAGLYVMIGWGMGVEVSDWLDGWLTACGVSITEGRWLSGRKKPQPQPWRYHGREAALAEMAQLLVSMCSLCSNSAVCLVDRVCLICIHSEGGGGGVRWNYMCTAQ